MAQKKTKPGKRKKDSNNGSNTVTGRIDITRSGMGFVIVEGQNKDILIKKDNLNNALNGDEVRVELADRGRKFGSRPEGKVTEVIRRKQNEFSGRLDVHPNFAFMIPDSDKMPVDIFIPMHMLNEAKHGDHVMVRITEWSPKAKSPVGEIISILTDESSNEIAMQSLLVENGFPLTFPDDVIEESERYPEGVDAKEAKKRKDMRGTLTFTIDPVDAKDFDDAISIKPLKGGMYEIGVHIADVSHYIEPGSALDKEAYIRATSVYLPDRVLPMLPERLSNGLCSLRPDEDKYTFSAIFKMDAKGKVKDYWLGKTVIRSNRRFTYEEAQEMIEGADGDHKDEILLLNEIAKTLRAARFKKGAINFSSQEVRFKLDETGKPIGIVVKESKEAHQLIEEFMLLANRTVAEYVSEQTYKDKPVPFPYRVHDVPDEAKLGVFSAFAARFGHRFNMNTPDSIASSFNEMLKQAQGRPEQHVLESLGIRTMAKAVYTTENIGHYGLGFKDYCHFTSPIRRYPDVLVHRVLEQCLNNEIKPIKQMEQLCRHCSDQERRAMEAERAANKYKQVEFMRDYIGEEFEAVISGVASFGFWAETVEHKCEGMVSIADLAEIDEFEHVDGEYALIGRRTGARFGIGDKVKVRVAAANLDKRQIDYVLVAMPEQQQHRPPQKKRATRPGQGENRSPQGQKRSAQGEKRTASKRKKG
ncbi:MAG: ribonuclease R [Sphingobacteriales bacterium]|nr:MAG: ribonuclease R [Sphingobacteriales bacterium]